MLKTRQNKPKSRKPNSRREEKKKKKLDTNSRVEANLGFIRPISAQSSCPVQLAHHGGGVGKDLDERLDLLSFV
jgi:hypothetical protein